MKLNKKQKQFLFENCYVTAKVLDACVEPGWQNYFIRYFDWKLENVELCCCGRQFIGKLKLYNREYKETWYEIRLNFQDNDYYDLLEL